MTSKTYQVEGTDISSFTTADFDGNGIDDLALTGIEQGKVAILLNKGDGTFPTIGLYKTGEMTRSVAAGDFNNDGKPDLAAALSSSGNNHVAVLLNKGNGTFEPAIIYPAGDHEFASIIIGDFNGDGDADLLLKSTYENVSMLMNKGDGTFGTALIADIIPGILLAIETADFNGDNKDDLAITTDFPDRLYIRFSRGDGTFEDGGSYLDQPGSRYGVSPGDMTTADFNSDGKIDLAVRIGRSETIGILLNKGDGSFLSAGFYKSGGKGPVAVAAGDFNSDGKIDLAVANYGSGNVGVLLNKGDGSFHPAVNFETENFPVSLSAGHFNSDNKPDLLVRYGRSGLYSNIFSPSGAKFGLLLNTCHTTGNSPLIWYRDFDGDGFGNPQYNQRSLTQPTGYVANNLDCNDYKITYEDKDNDGHGNRIKVPCSLAVKKDDCNDFDPKVHSPQTFYRDFDGDSYGAATDKLIICSSTPPPNYVRNAIDCNDNDPGVYWPKTYYRDADGDGLGDPNNRINVCSSTPPAGYVTNSRDTNDRPVTVSNTRTDKAEDALQRATPDKFTLAAYPNPFNRQTRIQYTVPVDAQVNIKVFDVLGREVGLIFNGQRNAGTHYAEYNTSKLSSGMYYCRMVAIADGKEIIQTQKLVKTE